MVIFAMLALLPIIFRKKIARLRRPPRHEAAKP
jgi:hypothetical protein